MTDPIRLGIIGTGLIVATKHWPALSALEGEFQVVALVNRTLAKAEVLAQKIEADTGFHPATYDDYRKMLASEQPDAVSLALPPVLNPEVAEAALAAGCHVIAEKPIAASLGDGARMAAWAEAYSRTVMIAENYRYLASYQRAREMIAQGIIGQPQTARWSLYQYLGPDNPYYQTAWRQRPEHPGGYLSDGGVHHVAALRTLLGDVETVVGHVVGLRPDLGPADTLSATLCFSNGALGTYAITYAMPGPRVPLEVAGPDGVLLVGRYEVELWERDRVISSWDAPSPVDGSVAMYEDFAQAIHGGKPPRSTPAEALEDLRLIVAILRSSESGRPMLVREVL